MTANQAQFDLTFQPGLTEQFPNFRDVLRAAVYDCGRALKIVAADLDMTSSELSRKLADNPNDNVNFPAHMLPELIRATGDKRPLYWLIETFLDDADSKRKRAISDLQMLLPQIEQALRQVGAGAAR
jgi:hypothetical protein